MKAMVAKESKVRWMALKRPDAARDAMLIREGRKELLDASCHFLPFRAELDLAGWAEQDIFAHS